MIAQRFAKPVLVAGFFIFVVRDGARLGHSAR